MLDVTLSKMADAACLMANDMKHIHLHATGVNFDTIHSICNELYEEASKEMDWFAERAIAIGEAVGNFSSAADRLSDEWVLEEQSEYDWDKFTSAVSVCGERYINALKSVEASNSGDQSVIDGYIDYWDKAIEYKNNARME